jgi:hypothetical protein
MLKFKNIQIFKMFRIFKKKRMKKEKKKNQNKIVKPDKKEKKTVRKKPSYHRVNGPAQRRAHAGGAEFRPANGRSLGIAERRGTGSRAPLCSSDGRLVPKRPSIYP